jgi:hypothetical protein
MTQQGGPNPPQKQPALLPAEIKQIEVPDFKGGEGAVTVHEPHVVRARLAYGLLYLLAGVMAVLLLLVGDDVWNGRDWTNLKDLFTLAMTPIATLAGAAFGFFFGNASKNDT